MSSITPRIVFSIFGKQGVRSEMDYPLEFKLDSRFTKVDGPKINKRSVFGPTFGSKTEPLFEHKLDKKNENHKSLTE